MRKKTYQESPVEVKQSSKKQMTENLEASSNQNLPEDMEKNLQEALIQNELLKEMMNLKEEGYYRLQQLAQGKQIVQAIQELTATIQDFQELLAEEEPEQETDFDESSAKNKEELAKIEQEEAELNERIAKLKSGKERLGA